jgi:hypothetical protein
MQPLKLTTDAPGVRTGNVTAQWRGLPGISIRKEVRTLQLNVIPPATYEMELEILSFSL